MVDLEGFPEDLEHFGSEQIGSCVNDTANIRLWLLNIVQNLSRMEYRELHM